MNLKADIPSIIVLFCAFSLLSDEALTHTIENSGPKDVLPSSLLKIANEAYELNIKGLKLLEFKKYEEAFDYFNKSIDKVPNYSDALNNKGVVYFRRGNIGLASELWEKVIKIDPEYAISYYNLGMIAYHDKKFKKAKNYFLKAIENKKRFEEAYIMLGKINLQLGEKKTSLHRFKRAYRINPVFKEAWENYAFALIQNGDTSSAVKILLKNRNTVTALTMLGQIMAGKGNYKKAVDYFSKALSKGGDPSILLQLATVYYNSR
ncbi:MAG: tetratricopeptide repeat protein, partial [Chitinispirillia bacterium]